MLKKRIFISSVQSEFSSERKKIGKSWDDIVHDTATIDVIDRNAIDYFLKKYLHSPIHFEGMQRIETLEIPDKAFREILYNAIAHKNYTGATIQMHVYDGYCPKKCVKFKVLYFCKAKIKNKKQ